MSFFKTPSKSSFEVLQILFYDFNDKKAIGISMENVRITSLSLAET